MADTAIERLLATWQGLSEAVQAMEVAIPEAMTGAVGRVRRARGDFNGMIIAYVRQAQGGVQVSLDGKWATPERTNALVWAAAERAYIQHMSPDLHSVFMRTCTWDDLPPEVRDQWYDIMREALRAIREPIPAQITAALAADPLACDVPAGEEAVVYSAIWRAMIERLTGEA